MIVAGTKLGRYVIRSKIGEGGMGEVYLADDVKLGRTVALKILTAEVAADHKRMQRFVQEARLASSLNHPHIVTIYEIEEEAQPPFIATEYIQGKTLRERLKDGGMPLSEVLGVCEQIASALAAAHEAGIIHRDIKPENVMLRRDGYVKVLDFGLAKLAEHPVSSVDTEAQTRALVKTDPGAVMGTVAYMSPEQARGAEVDQRTDIWSLGIVLYEMLTGQVPFRGKSAGHTIVSIQDEEPPPLSRFVTEVPEALQEVISDALAKDPEARPAAKQLLARLNRLKRRLDAGTHLDHSVPPNISEAGAESGGGTIAAHPGTPSTLGGSAASATNAAVAGTITGGHDTAAPGGRRRTAVAVVALLAVALAAGALAAYRFGWIGKTKAPAGQMKFTRLTNTGQASDADISPDGKFVVHVKREAGRSSLWLRQVETTSDTQILPPTDDIIRGIAFSRDGGYIYFLRALPNTAASLYQMSLLGGTPRKLTDSVISRITLSPDGKRMAFIRLRSPGEYLMVVANSDGTDERVVAVRKQPNAFTGGSQSWSPDGKSIASGALNVEAGNTHATLVEVEVEGEAERTLTPERWSGVGAVAWLPDKSGLIFTAFEEGTQGSQIWHLSYPEGVARKVTTELNSYSGVRLTADASALVTVQTEGESNIWVGPAGEAARARQITSGRVRHGQAGISWTLDGRIVYAAQEGGLNQIWIMNADGTGARQLTAHANRGNNQPVVTPDGRYIVFRSRRSGTWDIWRMDLDGGNVKQLTSGGNDNYARPSPDSRWVVFSSNRAGMQNLWKVSIDGGEPVRLTEKFTINPAVSPDGKLIACHYRDHADAPYKIALIPVEGGEPVRLLDFSQRFVGSPGLRWTPDGRSLLYLETQGGVSNIWSLPVEGGAPKQVTDFKSDEIFRFDFSHDGRQLAVSRGQITNDVVLISNFR